MFLAVLVEVGKQCGRSAWVGVVPCCSVRGSCGLVQTRFSRSVCAVFMASSAVPCRSMRCHALWCKRV